MIPVVDSWGSVPPPPGAADDDELFAASGADAAVVIGDGRGLERALGMGVRVLTHIGVRPQLMSLTRRQVRSKLPQRSDLVPMSIWTAGLLSASIGHGLDPKTAPGRPVSTTRPFVLPIASDPRAIDAFRLVAAAALLTAADRRCLIGLPFGATEMPRARRWLCASDRIVSVEALPRPAPAYITRADIIVDFGVTPGGSIDAACRSAAAIRIDAADAATPMSIATAIVQGARAGASV